MESLCVLGDVGLTQSLRVEDNLRLIYLLLPPFAA